MEKKEIYKYLLFILFFIAICCNCCLFVSCEKRGHNDIETLVFDVSDDSSVPLSDIADNIIKIGLETADECLLKDVRQVEIFENYLLVKDISPFLYVFDMEGKFIRRIGTVGNGPGEYTLCTRFFLDEQNKKIFLKTNVGTFLYDIKGIFLEKHPLRQSKGSITSIFYDNDFFYLFNYVFFNENTDFYQDIYFEVYDKSLNIVDSLLMHRYKTGFKREIYSGIRKPIFRNGEDIYVYYPRSDVDEKKVKDTLYIVDNFRLCPFLDIRLSNSQKDDRINYIFTTTRYTIVNYSTWIQEGTSSVFKIYSSQCVYDCKTKKSRHAKDGFTDDRYNNDHVIISPMFKQDMFYYIKEEEYSEELGAEPNPTIYIGKFKE
ncbi:hypothetical protein FACS1894155_08100 [Bacteroidia bacterium]|nr:hypothetical protein FACS1894155_08100 [Bacteroidia bacterium]